MNIKLSKKEELIYEQWKIETAKTLILVVFSDFQIK
jgi:hypothetical protein